MPQPTVNQPFAQLRCKPTGRTANQPWRCFPEYQIHLTLSVSLCFWPLCFFSTTRLIHFVLHRCKPTDRTTTLPLLFSVLRCKPTHRTTYRPGVIKPISNKSSSPRGSARGGSITSGPRGTPATIGTREGPGSATAASKGGAAAASGPRGGGGSVGVGPRGGVVVANGPRGGGTSSGGKGLGVSSVARGGGVSGGARGGGATRGGSKTSSAAIGGVGPRGGAGGAASGGKGKGLSGGGSALKRSAVAHLANLKRARVDEDDSMRRTPVNEASSVFFSVFFILFSAVLVRRTEPLREGRVVPNSCRLRLVCRILRRASNSRSHCALAFLFAPVVSIVVPHWCGALPDDHTCS